MARDMSVENSGELEFAALHADDLLLDALGARRPAGASGDVVAGLLQAYVLELDTRPGPLTGLLVAEDEFVPMPQAVPAMVAAPDIAEPLVEPVPIRSHRRARNVVAHRAAAVVTVGALVLGLGGVSAAVTGQGGPIDGIRRVVGSVTDQVTPQGSDADKISHTLSDAQSALAANDLRRSRELLEKARNAIEGQSDQTAFSALRANLVELRDRWHQAFDDSFTDPNAPAEASKPGKSDGKVPGSSVLNPEGKSGSLVGGGQDNPAKELTGPESGIKQTKDEIADRAEQKLEPLPDLPVGEVRAPTWAPIIGDGTLTGK